MDSIDFDAFPERNPENHINIPYSDLLKSVMQAPVGIIIMRGERMIVEMANDTYLSIVDRKAEEFIGRSLYASLPEVEEAVSPILYNILQTGEPFYGNEFPVFLNRFGKKEQTYFNFVYHPLREDDGAVSGVMVVATEVTEQVRTKIALELKESQFRKMVSESPIAMAVLRGREFIIEIVNKTLLTKMWRKEESEVLNRPLLAVFPELESQQFPDLLRNVYDTGVAHRENEAVAFVDSHDGRKKFYLDFEYSPLTEISGEISGVMITVHDVTEKVIAKQTLTGSEEKFRMLANSMPQFIWTAAADGTLNYFSQSVFDYSGLSEEELFQRGWLEIVHPEDRDENIRLWLESVSTGINFHYEHRFRKSTGEFRWQLSRAVAQKDEHGNILRWVGTSTDIHDRIRFSDELKQKVDERTRELKTTNEELLKSNSELLQFTYVASHDLQEPLRKIQTFISRIQETEADRLSKNGLDYFNRIQNSANRTQLLIRDLLEFSRTNTHEKSFEPTDLNLLISKVKEDLSERIFQRNTEIHSQTLPVLSVIPYQIEQLFANLISNAIKFSRPGAPSLIQIDAAMVYGSSVSSDPDIAGISFHQITVTDNGIGFEPEFSEKIFQVFQRLHSREDFEGTGIGLAICKRIAENHRGFIRAEGSPLQGARFHIYFPAAR